MAANHHFLFSELKAPIAILGAEVDRISPPELLKKFEEVLSSRAEVCQIPVLHTRFQDQRTINVSCELFAIDSINNRQSRTAFLTSLSYSYHTACLGI